MTLKDLTDQHQGRQMDPWFWSYRTNRGRKKQETTQTAAFIKRGKPL